MVNFHQDVTWKVITCARAIHKYSSKAVRQDSLVTEETQMRLKNVAVKNFRLLQDVSLVLEGRTTVVVGRNNCGKTSLTEVMRRLLGMV